MAARLSFAEFDAKLKSGTLSPAEYRRCLEIDPTADVVRVRLRTGALRDAAPPRYDVDREVYLAERAQQERETALAPVGLKRVVAEGDSWFNLPRIIRPQAIADRLKSNELVAVKNIARWGHTLAQMLERKEYLEEIRRFNPDFFVFSGGGNDLQELLKCGGLLQSYVASRPIDQCLSAAGGELLQEIAEGYRTLLNQIAVNYPSLRSLCYAYDYPRPTYKNGKYIGQYFKKMGYPQSVWNAVAKVIIDSLSESVEPVVKAFPNSCFLDCRGTTASYPFFDDMHPDTEGFRVLARQFEQALGVAMAPASEPGIKKRAARRVVRGTSTKRKQRRVKRAR
ncbi:MAG: SGNH/GDSL hydrolase family protein [Vicinamibacterales bacterium]